MMFFSEVLPKEAQVPECFKSFVAVMCESVAESLSDTDVEIVYWKLGQQIPSHCDVLPDRRQVCTALDR